MEGLRNVRRRKLHDHLLPALCGVLGIAQTQVSIRSIRCLVVENLSDDVLRKRRSLEKECEVDAIGNGRLDNIGLGEFRREFFGQFLRLLSFDLQRGDLRNPIQALAISRDVQ